MERFTKVAASAALNPSFPMAKAAVEGAVANVEINLADLKDEVFVTHVRQRVTAVRA